MKEKKSDREFNETVAYAAILGLVGVASGIAYFYGWDAGKMATKKLVLAALAQAARDGDVVVSVSSLSSAKETWFQISMLAEKPNGIVPFLKSI